MGNKSGKYNLEKFVTEFDTTSINLLEQKEIREKLENILTLFNQDNYYYRNLKNDKNSIFYEHKETDINKMTDYSNMRDQIDNIENEKSMMKSWKFCNMITFCIKINFTDKDIYVILLDIYSYLSNHFNFYFLLVKEKEFLFFFVKNSLEELCNMIQVNELKQSLIFYHKLLKLFNDIVNYINSDENLIIQNLTGLRKMSTVAKMLIDPIFCKDKEIKLSLLNFLKVILIIFRNLYGNFGRDSQAPKNKEFLNIVKLTINEYYNSKVFTKMSEDLTKLDNTVTFEMQKIIIECFNLLAQFDFVIYNQFINSEREVEHSFYIIDLKAADDIVIETLKFLLNFYINSLNQECFENFNLFHATNKKIEEKIFQIFIDVKNQDIKFLISMLFFVISAVQQNWECLNSLEMIKPTQRFMKFYIAETFKISKFKENDPVFLRRIEYLEIFYRIFDVISDEKTFSLIFHTDYFRKYFDAVIFLFHVYHPKYKLEILKTMNVFTYFNDCKMKALKNKNTQIINFLHLRLQIVFKDLKRVYSIYEVLAKQKENLIDENRKTLDAEFYDKIVENIQIVETSCEESKKLFFKTLLEFGLLMSIFINLMMTNEYKNSKNILLQNNPNFFDDIKPEDINSKDFSIIDNLNFIKSINNEESNGYTLSNFESFLKENDLLINEFGNHNNYNYLSKYTVQIVIARLINNPNGKFEIGKKRGDLEAADKEESEEIKNLEILFDYLKQYKTDHDILHKLLYAINRLLNYKRNHKAVIETIKRLIEEIKNLIFKEFKSSIIVNRECLRLFCTLTTFAENTLLWLKFDSKKVHVDNSNYSDLLLKYKNEETDWDQDNPDKERILFPPYLKVKSYADKMGVIFYGEHVLILPKKLHLGNTFTISFRFFNPVINSKNWHVLLQDPSGIGGLIVVDASKSKLGCFTTEGKFIDSGIDLNDQEYSKKWIHVAMTYGIKAGPKNKSSAVEINEQRTLIWYVNGNEVKRYEKEKIILPQTIQYIGNSRDYNEPFGVFCDVRIYTHQLNNSLVKRIFSNEDNSKSDINEYDIMHYIYHKFLDHIIDSFLETRDVTEETFYFTIKFLNNMMSEKNSRNKLINYKLILKILGYYTSKKIDVKKEISKFMMIVS